jgi:Transmembrane amino acid transporter protein
MLQVINTAYGITASICGLMGTLGYLMYGNGVKDVVTFNLPPVRLSIMRWRRSCTRLHAVGLLSSTST